MNLESLKSNSLKSSPLESVSRVLNELWKFRSLLFALVRRHLGSRYRGSVLGFIWSFLNPLCLLMVYSLVFKYYIRFDGVENYTLFLFTGLLPWIWFSSGISEATSSISSGGNLITKAMFPPHLLPIVAVSTNLIHFLISLPLLVIALLWCGYSFSFSIFYLPIVIFSNFIFTVGLSMACSAINVRFRDLQHIVANLLTLLFFLCPVLYPIEQVPEKFRFTMSLNPLAVFTKMYQRIFLDSASPGIASISISLIVSILVFICGVVVFERYRDEFAELV